MPKKILLWATVAFFTALTVQAYFDPSVGRWASRDSINEEGSHLLRYPDSYTVSGAESLLGTSWDTRQQSLCRDETPLYLFNSNDGVNGYDLFGMMSAADVQNDYEQRKAAIAAANIKCSCTCTDQKDTYSISGGVSSGGWFSIDTVFGYSSWRNCVGSSCCGPLNTTYYWWDCYSGHDEGDKNNRGWSVGSIKYSKTATPALWGFNGGTGSGGDPNHLDMTSVVIFERCIGGKIETKLEKASNHLEFTWSLLHQSWTGPVSSNN